MHDFRVKIWFSSLFFLFSFILFLLRSTKFSPLKITSIFGERIYTKILHQKKKKKESDIERKTVKDIERINEKINTRYFFFLFLMFEFSIFAVAIFLHFFFLFCFPLFLHSKWKSLYWGNDCRQTRAESRKLVSKRTSTINRCVLFFPKATHACAKVSVSYFLFQFLFFWNSHVNAMKKIRRKVKRKKKIWRRDKETI